MARGYIARYRKGKKWKINSNSSVRRETEDINLLSSVKKMAITPKFSPPKKIVVSPPSPKNSSPGGSGTSKKKGRAPLFGESDLQPPLVQATTTSTAKFGGQGKGDPPFASHTKETAS